MLNDHLYLFFCDLLVCILVNISTRKKTNDLKKYKNILIAVLQGRIIGDIFLFYNIENFNVVIFFFMKRKVRGMSMAILQLLLIFQKPLLYCLLKISYTPNWSWTKSQSSLLTVFSYYMLFL